MSKFVRSRVIGIALALTLGTAAAQARPLSRPGARAEAAPAGIVQQVWNWWAEMVERVAPAGRKGLQAVWGSEGSQMDPDGASLLRLQQTRLLIPGA